MKIWIQYSVMSSYQQLLMRSQIESWGKTYRQNCDHSIKGNIGIKVHSIKENGIRRSVENKCKMETTTYSNINVFKFGNKTDYMSDEELAQLEIFHDYPDGLLRFAAVCCIMFIIVGIPGNLVTIIALTRCKKTQNATAIFIINLTVSDLLNCCINLPLAASTFWTERWTHGSSVCKFFPFARFGLFAVAQFSVLAITTNRYILLSHPTIYSRMYKPRNMAIIISCLWIVSFVALIPTLAGELGRFGLDPVSGYCNMIPDHNQRNPMKALFLCAFLIPSLAILVCYSRIFCLVQKATKKSHNTRRRVVVSDSSFNSTTDIPSIHPTMRPSKHGSNPLNVVAEHPRVTSLREGTVTPVPNSDDGMSATETRRFTHTKQQVSKILKVLPSSKDRRLLSMITAIIVAFVVCNLPITAVKVYYEFEPHPTAFIYSTLLKNLTICLNPLIYVVMSQEYRKAYKKAFNYVACKEILCRF